MWNLFIAKVTWENISQFRVWKHIPLVPSLGKLPSSSQPELKWDLVSMQTNKQTSNFVILWAKSFSLYLIEISAGCGGAYTFIKPTLSRFQNFKFKAHLGYTVSPCLKEIHTSDLSFYDSTPAFLPPFISLTLFFSTLHYASLSFHPPYHCPFY